MNKKLKNKNTGFTLVELIVSLGLFTVVMMISTSALLSLSDTNKKVQSMRVAFDNLNLALESMSREIRMGSVYHCDATVGTVTTTRDCDVASGGASSISFLSQTGEQITYQLNGATVKRTVGPVGPDAMTAPEIKITNLRFYVLGTNSGSNDQPRVIITISGTAGKRVTSSFNIQTTVTSRMPK